MILELGTLSRISATIDISVMDFDATFLLILEICLTLAVLYLVLDTRLDGLSISKTSLHFHIKSCILKAKVSQNYIKPLRETSRHAC